MVGEAIFPAISQPYFPQIPHDLMYLFRGEIQSCLLIIQPTSLIEILKFYSISPILHVKDEALYVGGCNYHFRANSK